LVRRRFADLTKHTPRAGKSSGGKTEKLSRYYGKQFGFAPPKKGQVSAGAMRYRSQQFH
jgi:hypothetical protein